MCLLGAQGRIGSGDGRPVPPASGTGHQLAPAPRLVKAVTKQTVPTIRPLCPPLVPVPALATSTQNTQQLVTEANLTVLSVVAPLSPCCRGGN